MRILLEGPDAVGKTTLAKTLVETFKANYIHFEYEKNDDIYLDQLDNTFKILFDNNVDIVIDRFIPSEVVYGNILRNTTRSAHNMINKMLDGFDYIIFCLPSSKSEYLEHFEKISNEREEMVKDLNHISQIYDGYQNFYIKLLGDHPADHNKIKRYDFFNVINKTV